MDIELQANGGPDATEVRREVRAEWYRRPRWTGTGAKPADQKNCDDRVTRRIPGYAVALRRVVAVSSPGPISPGRRVEVGMATG